MTLLYEEKYGSLVRAAEAIEVQIRAYLCDVPRIDRVCARAKSVDKYQAKAQKVENGRCKYKNPLYEIQDQIGARIITFYLSDVELVSSVIEKFYRPIESKSLLPESEWEFGYFGRHFVLLMPTEILDTEDEGVLPEFFELQVKTLFQHAWSEANHDLGYKPSARPLTGDEKRRLAFTAAQAWGADAIFEELSQRPKQA